MSYFTFFIIGFVVALAGTVFAAQRAKVGSKFAVPLLGGLVTIPAYALCKLLGFDDFLARIPIYAMSAALFFGLYYVLGGRFEKQ